MTTIAVGRQPHRILSCEYKDPEFKEQGVLVPSIYGSLVAKGDLTGLGRRP